jgi:hypothetical protein
MGNTQQNKMNQNFVPRPSYNIITTNVPMIYDPNMGSFIPIERKKEISVELAFPTMAPGFFDRQEITPFDDSDLANSNFCYSDEDCMNLDSFSSSPKKGLVYSCPKAKCVVGSCKCGPDCKKDPYSGMCCQGIKTIRGDAFCIENTAMPGLDSLRFTMRQKSMLRNKAQQSMLRGIKK